MSISQCLNLNLSVCFFVCIYFYVSHVCDSLSLLCLFFCVCISLYYMSVSTDRVYVSLFASPASICVGLAFHFCLLLPHLSFCFRVYLSLPKPFSICLSVNASCSISVSFCLSSCFCIFLSQSMFFFLCLYSLPCSLSL